MKTKALIFDLDGTLLDSLADISNSANHVLQQHGLPTHSADEYRYFVGNGVKILMERIVPAEHRQNETYVRQLVDEMVHTYLMNWKNESKLFDGIPQMLRDLEDRGLRIAVLSNKPHVSTMRCVEHFMAEFPVSAALGQSPECPAKPDPQGALEIAGRLSVSPETCMFVGDTAVDMETAVTAGMCPIGVSWGFRDRDELVQAGAQQVIDHPSQLIQIVDQRQESGDLKAS